MQHYAGMHAEIRRPKPEGRKKTEARNPKAEAKRLQFFTRETRETCGKTKADSACLLLAHFACFAGTLCSSGFWLRRASASQFGLSSDFHCRTSDL
jgi:hypothetical protein